MEKRSSKPMPWLWRPTLIVFVSNCCIMILELVAGRIIAPTVGVSLYTWTSVIGVILAGISLGNTIGGWLADRAVKAGASLRLLGLIFVLAGLFSVSIVALDKLNLVDELEWPIVAKILSLIAVLFFVPSTILGTISPIVVKLAMNNLDETGSTVGRIYAAGSVGSIVGTFATGFVLISHFGTYPVVWGVSFALLILGLAFLVHGRPQWVIAGVLVLGSVSVYGSRLDWLESPCTRETNYFCIKVHEQEHDGETVRVLTLDRLVHSYTSLDNPTKLVYGYERAYAEATAYQAKKHNHLRALFIGGGGYTFPRYMETVYPGSDLEVIEIDPDVTEVAYDYLGLKRDTTVISYNEDARMFLQREPTAKYDLVMGDAFNDFSVPYHLTTKEFNDRVHAWLEPDGLYMVNIIDGARGQFLRAYTHTLQQSFKHVYLSPTIEQWRESVRSTFVLIASDTPLELEAFEQDSLFIQRMLTSEQIETLLAQDRLVTLTDRYAPVGQMLAPVFLDKAE